MEKVVSKIKKVSHVHHETKRRVLLRFLLVLLVILAYFVFTVYTYGLKDGIAVTIITWSFFVFCTPIADAGFILDFPIRLLFNIRMIRSEMIVWIVAAIANVVVAFSSPAIYEKTLLLSLFKTILINPVPFGAIIVLSGVGTFMSVYFGDELLDKVRHSERKTFHKHKIKHRLLIVLTLIVITISMYYLLLSKLGIVI